MSSVVSRLRESWDEMCAGCAAGVGVEEMRNDTREELAADVRAWLEWQKMCGTDVWQVDDISVCK